MLNSALGIWFWGEFSTAFIKRASVRTGPPTRILRRLVETPDSRPRDLAKQLSLPITEVRNAIKRQSRKLRAVREAWPSRKEYFDYN